MMSPCKPPLLAALLLPALAATAGDAQHPDVITLAPRPAAPLERHVGRRCASLLREDFSLYRGSGCRDANAAGEHAELKIEERPDSD